MGEGLKRAAKTTKQKRPAILHFGRKAPKELLALGYREVSAMHLGHGAWLIRLEKQEGSIL